LAATIIPETKPGHALKDTGVTSFDGDGIYLINMGNGQQIKRLIDRDIIHVASDNKSYGEPLTIPEGTVIGGKVLLRNRIERFN
jgi:phage repressor protein C with HTH and peptisase S24 domain